MNETKLRAIASGMDYPHTPDIAGPVSARLLTSTRSRFSFKALAWSLTLIVVLCTSLMLIPPARAAILEFIQIGVVRLFPPSSTPTVEPVTAATPATSTPRTAPPSTSPSTLLPLLEQIAGETTLAEVQKSVSYAIQLPAYPSELGEPDRVYLQNLTDGRMTVIVWFDPQQPDRVFLSLHFIPSDSWAINKAGPSVIRETQVNGQRAIWAEGPYPLVMKNGTIEFTRLIEGRVLIWSDGDITYRLETNASMEEAVKIAESLRTVR